jgi:hypothetical protein
MRLRFAPAPSIEQLGALVSLNSAVAVDLSSVDSFIGGLPNRFSAITDC